MRRLLHAAAVLALAALLLPAGARTADAQEEKLGGGAPPVHYRAGWTLTPSVGVAETWDDNVTLFGAATADGQTADYVSTVFPEVVLHYAGKHTSFGSGYSGSFLRYNTFSVLNRWDQGGFVDVKRQESARLKWTLQASLAAMPSTDLVDLGGIPFRHVGTLQGIGRGGLDYVLGRRDAITASYQFQSVTFDRTPSEIVSPLVLRGGHVQEGSATYLHRFSERLAAGGSYTLRRSAVIGDPEQFTMHMGEAALAYDLSSRWSMHAGAGVVHLLSTSTTAARSGPAWTLGIERHGERTTINAAYLRSYVPSFGFGGTVSNQEVNGGLRMILPGTRRFYTSESVIFRDDQPLTEVQQQLPLRSWRVVSILGWEAQPWMRLEGFYSYTRQNTLLAGGLLDRNRIGFQIVTSKPVRLQ
jgi:hypothetical protein